MSLPTLQHNLIKQNSQFTVHTPLHSTLLQSPSPLGGKQTLPTGQGVCDVPVAVSDLLKEGKCLGEGEWEQGHWHVGCSGLHLGPLVTHS